MITSVRLTKNPNHVFFLFALLCFLLFTSMKCKKDKLSIDYLPAKTQTGANTFGCLVNGEAVTPTINIFSYSNHFSYGYNPDYGFGTTVINEPTTKEYLREISIQLQIKNLNEGQTYLLNEYNITGKGGAKYDIFYDSGRHSDHYETNNQVSGTITITKLDMVKEIISGVFAFKAINSSNGEIVNVTDGRFDLKFK